MGNFGFVSIIDTQTNAVIGNINLRLNPDEVVFTADGSVAYVTNSNSNSVSFIDTATRRIIKTIRVVTYPRSIQIANN